MGRQKFVVDVKFAMGAGLGLLGLGLLYIALATLWRMRANYTDPDPFYAAFLAEHFARWVEHTIVAILVVFEIPVIWIIRKGRTL